ncbi:hypothetical protein ScalyP_jg8308 [Parmales sp. scaly parma]|nr:hypothetical protein ScalyP_jg8308 [Parmales sp. scaly parma]
MSNDKDETSSERKITIIGNGLSGYTVTADLLKEKKRLGEQFSIVVIEANSYYESDVKSIYCLNHPDNYSKNVTSQELLRHPGVEYVQGTVRTITQLHDQQVVIYLETERRTTTNQKPQEERRVPANAIICASGYSYPVLKPKLNQNFTSRQEELKEYFDAIKKANSVVVAGGGIVGLELAGEVLRLLDKADRDGVVKLVITGDYVLDSSYSKAERKFLTEKIRNTHNVDLITNEKIEGNKVYADKNVKFDGSASIQHATYSMSSGKTIEADVFFSAWPVPRTRYLEHLIKVGGAVDIWDESGDLIVNHKTLEAKNIRGCVFAVGCSDLRRREGNNAPKIKNQAKTVAHNVIESLIGYQMSKIHKGKSVRGVHKSAFMVGGEHLL